MNIDFEDVGLLFLSLPKAGLLGLSKGVLELESVDPFTVLERSIAACFTLSGHLDVRCQIFLL